MLAEITRGFPADVEGFGVGAEDGGDDGGVAGETARLRRGQCHATVEQTAAHLCSQVLEAHADVEVHRLTGFGRRDSGGQVQDLGEGVTLTLTHRSGIDRPAARLP